MAIFLFYGKNILKNMILAIYFLQFLLKNKINGVIIYIILFIYILVRRMIDIHTHILPLVDDGSGSFEESIEMLKNAEENGTKKLVLTPHFCNDRFSEIFSKDEILGRIEKFKAAALNAGIKIELYSGSEMFGIDDIKQKILLGEAITLNGSRYLLVEFDFYDDPERVTEVLDNILSTGLVPIVAHPERYEFMREDPLMAMKLVNKGSLLQLNKTSLLGLHGEQTRKLAIFLIEKRFASFIASDTHDNYMRNPDMSDVFGWVYSEISKKYAEDLFFNNPFDVLNNKQILTFDEKHRGSNR